MSYFYTGNGKAFQSAGIRLSSGFGSIQVRFRKSDQNPFFNRSVSAYRELLITAVLVVTTVQHRTMVLDKTSCMCSQTNRVDNTKSVHNRSKPAGFVRTAQGLSSNQNEVAITSKSELWRTALKHTNQSTNQSTNQPINQSINILFHLRHIFSVLSLKTG